MEYKEFSERLKSGETLRLTFEQTDALFGLIKISEEDFKSGNVSNMEIVPGQLSPEKVEEAATLWCDFHGVKLAIEHNRSFFIFTPEHQLSDRQIDRMLFLLPHITLPCSIGELNVATSKEQLNIVPNVQECDATEA